VRLGDCRWPELAEGGRRRLLIPLGATEQHGPHLPLATDTIIAEALAHGAAQARADVVVAPALPYGSSGEHDGFPGTLSLGQAAVQAAVVELVRSAGDVEDVVLVCWHGGNAAPVARAVAQLRAEGRAVAGWQPRRPAADAHAGRVETSLMLAIAPELVGAERPVGVTAALGSLLPVLCRRGVRAVSPSGVLGDARGATREEGEALRAELIADLGRFLDAPRTAVMNA
jgi:creatinine amidohydrolase